MSSSDCRYWEIYGIQNDIPISGIDENGVIEHSFELKQNHPNPFNPTTAIRYELPVNGNVSLKKFNNPGREVRTLVYGYVTAGIKQVKWDGKDNRGALLLK